MLAWLPEAESFRMHCRAPEIVDEEHLVQQGTSGGSVELRLHGLLADTTYECEIESDRGDRCQLQAHTAALEASHVDPVIVGDPLAATEDYVLFNHFTGGLSVDDQELVIYDRHGRQRWSHPVLPELTCVDASWIGEGRILFGGGFDPLGVPRIVGIDGEELFVGPDPSAEGNVHHDVEYLPSLHQIAMLSLSSGNTDGLTEWTGFAIDLVDASSAEILWSWDSQEAVAAGTLPSGTGDAYHANAMQSIVEADRVDKIWINLREINRLVRLDVGSRRLDLQLGPDGDYPLVLADGSPAPTREWFYWPHAPELRDDQTRALFHDNRNPLPEESSRVVELQLDHQARTATLGWSWSEPDWKEQAWGDVDTLVGGATLVARGHCDGSSCDETNPDSRTSIVELDAHAHEPVWELRYAQPEHGLYRAQAIDGCEIFSNLQYCLGLGAAARRR